MEKGVQFFSLPHFFGIPTAGTGRDGAVPGEANGEEDVYD